MTDPKALRELAKRACEAYRQGFTASLPVAEFLEAMLGNGAILSMLDKIEEGEGTERDLEMRYREVTALLAEWGVPAPLREAALQAARLQSRLRHLYLAYS